MPPVSVIIPVYNVEAYLPRCIESILNQTYPDFELILIDDGSKDKSGEICDEYAAKDGRIHVIHQENMGQGAARNVGLDWVFLNSKSEWIAFIDSDDWVHGMYLEILYKLVNTTNTQVGICDLVRRDCFCDDEMIIAASNQVMDFCSIYVSEYGLCMSPCAKIYHRSLWEHLRFPEGKPYEDAFVTHIPLAMAKKISLCKLPLYYYFTNPHSTTRAKWTTKRLSQMEAHEVRGSWLKTHGYEDAYKCDTEVYVASIYEQTEMLAKLSRTDHMYEPYLHQLRRKLRTELSKAKKMALYKLEREYLWIYLMAYPTLPVWYFGQWLRHMRNRFRGTE